MIGQWRAFIPLRLSSQVFTQTLAAEAAAKEAESKQPEPEPASA